MITEIKLINVAENKKEEGGSTLIFNNVDEAIKYVKSTKKTRR